VGHAILPPFLCPADIYQACIARQRRDPLDSEGEISYNERLGGAKEDLPGESTAGV